MKAYIEATACISPQNTIGTDEFPLQINDYKNAMLHCIEPNYKEYINPIQLRRMSKVLKMGLGASAICLKKLNQVNPDAIVVGTALGCGEDLEKFLSSYLDNENQVLSPTPFIQSTHNMVAAQIAVMLKNNNYNMTYCHRGFSFESALTDAIMLINEGHARSVLAGGIDEITPNNFRFYDYLNIWKKDCNSSLKLLDYHNNGTIAGEGACFFLLHAENSGEKSAIKDLSIFYKPLDEQEISDRIDSFLQKNKLDKENIDLLISGMNGDISGDQIYRSVSKICFQDKIQIAYYKHLCGEYATSVSFALWLADCILRSQHIPDIIKIMQYPNKPVNNILIYNHYRNNNHTLLLISRQ